MDWMRNNVSWLFSGLGVAALVGLLKVVRSIWDRRKSREQIGPQLDERSVTGIRVHEKGVSITSSSIRARGDIHIVGGDKKDNDRPK